MLKHNHLYLLSILALCLAFPGTLCWAAQKYDSVLEKKYNSLIKRSAKPGELVTLSAGSQKFAALWRESSGREKIGAAIFLHGQQSHPDWPNVIKPLRTTLPHHGWASLSVQLPVLAKGAPLKSYVPLFDSANQRIQAAIDYLKSKKKITNIVIIGYGLGANMGSYYLMKKQKQGVVAYVGISIISSREDPVLDASRSLAFLNIPMFDIYGGNDLDDVFGTLLERTPLIFKHRAKFADLSDPRVTRYRQLEIEGADHSYQGHEEHLLKRIRSWLHVFAPGQKKKSK